MTGNRPRFFLRTFLALLLIASATATTATKNIATTTGSQDNRLIIHEWGTFTSIAGKDGVAVEWHPLGGPSDLPEFVYDLNDLENDKGFRHGQSCLKACDEALIRMETPVLYFYSNKETDVFVEVRFPKGKITEWYPQARGAYPQGVVWGRIKVMPGAQITYPTENNPSHYYAARETDSATIRVGGTRGETQHEKFLFYRGIGNFDPPLVVTLRESKVVAKNTGDEEVGSLILFENQGGRVGFNIYDSAKRETERPALNRTIGELEMELERLLVARGLYEKEAKAMIKTWRDSWFEEGLRLFYVVPRRMTDALLPLNIDPQPAELVRVLVGRIELITPEMESSVARKVALLEDATVSVADVAMKIKREHGRFAEPILKRVLEKTGDQKLKARIERLVKITNEQAD
jgi:hypothetical protein